MVRAVKIIVIIAACALVIVVAAIIATGHEAPGTPPTVPQSTLESVADVGVVVHNHWTDDDVNDGRIVYVGLVNRRHEYISDEILGLTVTLTIKGLDEAYEEYSKVLFTRTYTDVALSTMDYPGGSGFVILFDDLAQYTQDCCTAIWAEVVLPDGRLVKTHDTYDFNITPLTSGA